MLDLVSNREVLVGEGSVKQLPAKLQWYGVKKALMVYSHSGEGVAAELKAALKEAGIDSADYTAIHKEPDTTVIDTGAEVCVREGCDCVVALGGGSVIDASKMISMLATNGGKTEEYQIDGRVVTKIPLLFVAIPTTAGTGAEATKVSVIFNKNKGYKKSAYDNSMIATLAILDPALTAKLPAKLTAATGMDAITHAIESYTSKNATVVSKMYSLKALDLLVNNIVTAYREPDNMQAREAMLLGSYFAGVAIAVGTCLAHIVGQPFGAIYGIPHGDACAIFLFPSMRFNKDYCLKEYLEIFRSLGVDMAGKTDDEAFEAGMAFLQDIAHQIHAPEKITEYVAKEKVDLDYAVNNIATSMAHIKHNPRPVSPELFREMILAAM